MPARLRLIERFSAFGELLGRAIEAESSSNLRFSPAGRDWRYTMIMPDGSLFGTTNGDGSARVEFCVTCHRAAGDDRDHLFFLPQEYRRRFLGAPAGP